MATIIDEHTQWVDSGGRPLTDGEMYVGIAGSDPVANPKSIFSDSSLTTSAENPQPLDSDGRTTLKLYVDGEYSVQVNDVNGTQQYQSLEAGSAADDVPIIGLTSISGGDTIVGSGGITAYTDKAIYSLTVAQVNTGPVTLNIDSVGAKSVFKNLDEELDGGDWQEDQNVMVSYNATSDSFHWIDQTVNLLLSGGAMSGTLSLAKGADVASAAALTLGTDGNYFDITGTTAITSIGAIGVGTVVKLHFDDALTLTHEATDLVLPGGADITTAAGDEAEFIEYATGDWICTNYQVATFIPGSAVLTEKYESTAQTISTAGQLILAHGLSNEPEDFEFWIENTTAEGGYTVGQKTLVNPAMNDDASTTNRGMSVIFDSTNITIRFGSQANSAFGIMRADTGVRFQITNANWDFYVRAFA